MEFVGQVENAHSHLTNKKIYNYKYLHNPMNTLSLKKTLNRLNTLVYLYF